MNSTRRQPQPRSTSTIAAARGGDDFEWPIRLSLMAAVTASFVAGLSEPSNWRWGMNLLRYYPPLSATIFWVVTMTALAFVPPLGGRPPAQAAPPRAGSRWAPWQVGLAACGLAAGFFWAARSHSFLLGDGYEIVRRLRQQLTPAPRAPLFNILAPRLFKLLGGFAGVRPHTAAGAVSLLAGSAAVGLVATFVARLARRNPAGALTAGVLLLVTPAVQVFCLYVESYAPLIGASLLFFAAGFDRLLSGSRLGLAAALAAQGVALAAHPFGIALLPGTLFLLAWSPEARRLRLDRRGAAAGAAAIAALGLALGLFFHFHPELRASNEAYRYLAPQEHFDLLYRLFRDLLVDRPWASRYRIDSTLHAADLFNTIWLVGAVGIAWIAPLPFHAAGRRALTSPTALLALVTLPPVLLFRALVRTPLGALRDWDLFADAGLALAALAAGAALSGAGRRLALPALVAGAFFTLPWLGIQRSDERAARRHFEALEAEPRPEPFVAAGFHGVMGDRFAELKRFDLARRAYERSLDAYPRYDYAWRLGVVDRLARDDAGAARAFEWALRLQPDDREALTALGNCLTALGRYAAADSVLARSIALYPRESGAALIFRARAAFLSGRDTDGRRWLKAARRTLPANDVAWRDLKALEAELDRAARDGAASPGGDNRVDTPPERR